MSSHLRQLLIRADASAKAGMGHLMRCMAIGQAWIDAGGAVTLVTRNLPDSMHSRVVGEDFRILPVASPAGSVPDARALVATASESRAEAIILDSYAFNEEYHSIVSRAACTSLAVDDSGKLSQYTTDLVLNPNAGVSEDLYRHSRGQTKLLLGPKFALLRREFRLADPARHEPGDCTRILVTLGGSDPLNVTQTVIRELSSSMDLSFRSRVIAGGLNPGAEMIRNSCKSDARFEFFRNAVDMSAHYQWADIAVTAGGSSNWEMCYFDLPRAILVLADNQRRIAEELERLGVAINLGEPSQLGPGNIADAVKALVLTLAERKAATLGRERIVDGLGAERCVRELWTHRRSSRNLTEATS